jgi:hypothetical protein
MWSTYITRAALTAAVILEAGCGNGAASERAVDSGGEGGQSEPAAQRGCLRPAHRR